MLHIFINMCVCLSVCVSLLRGLILVHGLCNNNMCINNITTFLNWKNLHCVCHKWLFNANSHFLSLWCLRFRWRWIFHGLRWWKLGYWISKAKVSFRTYSPLSSPFTSIVIRIRVDRDKTATYKNIPEIEKI